MLINKNGLTINDNILISCRKKADEIVIDADIRAVGIKSFSGIKATKITIPEGVVYIGYEAFLSCENLESVDLPQSLRFISPYAFKNCNKLKSITLPDNIQSVGYKCFEGDKIKYHGSNISLNFYEQKIERVLKMLNEMNEDDIKNYPYAVSFIQNNLNDIYQLLYFGQESDGAINLLKNIVPNYESLIEDCIDCISNYENVYADNKK